MGPSHSEIILAYRHLYKHILRAVQYSKPARFIARDRIRTAFQLLPAEAYNGTQVSRTLDFLDAAAKTKGLEHKVVKNLMHVWWEQQHLKGAKLYVCRLRSKDRSNGIMSAPRKAFRHEEMPIVASIIRSSCWTKAWAFA